MSEAINNKEAIGTITVNIGEIYLAKGDDQLALNYFQKSRNPQMPASNEWIP